MASILDRYGIKEVADVTFYEIDANGGRGKPVLYLDTLKVSTIEQTAETADARGGKGNPKLISWDYGKEINVSIEDALFSSKSMAIMFGNGTVSTGSENIKRTIMVRLDENGKLPDTIVADFCKVREDGTKTSVRGKVYMSSDDTNKPGDATMFADTKINLVSLTAEDGDPIQPSGESDAFTLSDWGTAIKKNNVVRAFEKGICASSRPR